MSRRAEPQGAYVLHRRAYRETSLLIDLLLQSQGRLTAIAKGVRRKPGHAPEQFTRYRVALAGRGSLKVLASLEVEQQFRLAGDSLYAGMYVNELLMRTSRPSESLDGLFEAYGEVINGLADDGADVESVLRKFELRLLHSLGYQLSFERDGNSGSRLEPELMYHFESGKGLCSGTQPAGSQFRGSTLLNVAKGNFQSREARRAAKHILRQALDPIIGDKPLKSPELLLARSLAGNGSANAAT